MNLNQQILLLEKFSNKKVILEEDNEDTIFKPTHLTDNRKKNINRKYLDSFSKKLLKVI